MNIVLIGYRGTGKSAVGARVAQQLGMVCVSMDAAIVARAGMPIPQIVAQHGWLRFRDLETLEARELAARDRLVIDTGGGVIERPENLAALRQNGRVIWLRASAPTIVSRIQGGTERPALTDGKTFTEEVAEVLERRTPMYAAAAQGVIDTDALTVDEVAAAVVAFAREARHPSS